MRVGSLKIMYFIIWRRNIQQVTWTGARRWWEEAASQDGPFWGAPPRKNVVAKCLTIAQCCTLPLFLRIFKDASARLASWWHWKWITLKWPTIVYTHSLRLWVSTFAPPRDHEGYCSSANPPRSSRLVSWSSQNFSRSLHISKFHTNVMSSPVTLIPQIG
jgi:hypothetical protein